MRLVNGIRLVYFSVARGNDLFIGIDGGGTGCRALVCDRSGKPLGGGAAGSANVMTDFEATLQNTLQASRQALKEAGFDENMLSEVPAFLGLAGANIGDFAQRLRGRLPFKDCIIETDAHIALQGAIGSQDGVVAIIGTGTIFIYRRQGVVFTAGGWGFMVGDLASGAWLGRRLLQEVLLTYDGIRNGSALTEHVLEHFEDNPQTVVEYAHTAKPGEFGELAPLVIEYADRDDAIARRIVRRAVSDIEETLDVIMAGEDQSFCVLGGLGRTYTRLLSERYRNRVRPPLADAVTGAAQSAVKHFAAERSRS